MFMAEHTSLVAWLVPFFIDILGLINIRFNDPFFIFRLPNLRNNDPHFIFGLSNPGIYFAPPFYNVMYSGTSL